MAILYGFDSRCSVLLSDIMRGKGTLRSLNSQTSPAEKKKNSAPIHHKAPNPKRPDRSLISSPRHCVRSGNLITKRCVVKRSFAISTFPKMHLICPPKFCISIVFNFCWDGCNTQEKWKTKVKQNFGGQIRCIMGGDVEVAYGLLGSGLSILREKTWIFSP